jgi:DNA-binding transcriptional LysR family regulator
LISGQDVLTLATMRDKLAAQIAGLGIGFLPRHLAESALADGRLVSLKVDSPRPDSPLCAAWRASRTGRALRWFARELEKPDVAASIAAAFVD